MPVKRHLAGIAGISLGIDELPVAARAGQVGAIRDSSRLFAPFGGGFVLDVDETAHVVLDELPYLLGGGAVEACG